EFAYAIKETSNGGFIVVGSTKSYGAGDTDIFLVKTDSTGTIDWSKTYGGVAEDYANDLIIDAEGNYVISGTTKSFGGGGSDCYLLKVKNNGDLLWANTYGGVDDEVNWGLTQTTNGWYTFVGQTKSYGSGGIDMFLVRTDLDGLNNSSCDNSDSATTVSSPTTNSMGGYWLTSGVTTTDSSMVMTNSSLSPSIVCFGCDSLLPGYTFHRTSFQVIFIDLSSGGFVVKWDFGDGDTSSLQNPTHTYATSGTYKVCLTIGNSCGIDSFCGNITVGTGLSILELGSSGSIIKVDIAPNPFEHYAKFSVQLDQKSIQETSFALYDVLGNQVMSKDRLSANNFFVYKDVLPSGIYFYLFTHQQRIIGTGKLIIQ
ncbi:MAG: T9SS type A sorting domain-containing protein, partial [Bacteroidetes bacterium]|nr:T9SS type A sorting domain-containing protein [Bacteroidota bacterium]